MFSKKIYIRFFRWKGILPQAQIVYQTGSSQLKIIHHENI
jgi:hypothetical protein